MPLYEYKCERCGDTFEVMQKFSDQPLTTHEGCGGPVERLISPSALQFKGSGWYITDYARSGGASGKNGKEGESAKPEASKADSPKASDSGKAESSKTESSKPAPASPAASSKSDRK
jgi:putative FmdB family regulatory protein